MYKILITTVLFCLLCSSRFSLAENTDSVNVGEWDFSLGLGYGAVENPIGGIDNINLYLLPSVSYYGDDFFLENTTLGYSLFENDEFIFDLVGRLNNDGLYFNFESFGVLTALGLDGGRRFGFFDIEDIERDISYLGGLAGTYSNPWLDISAGYYYDLTGVHNGNEIDLLLSRSFEKVGWNFFVEAGANYKSQKLLSYYYQIEQSESIIFVGLYNPDSSGINYHFRMSTEKRINKDWIWTAFYKKTYLDSQIKNSPIIDKDTFDLYFVGVKYTF